MPPSLSNTNIRNRLILSVGALLILVGVAGYFIVIKSQHDVIEQQALTVAKIVTEHAKSTRSVYSSSIVQKVKNDGSGFADIDYHTKAGGVPLPAQFLKKVSGKASRESDGLYEYRAVSKWNLAPDQSLNNDFLQLAWEKLEVQNPNAQSKSFDWKPSYSVINNKGNETLMYLEADPVTNQSCIDCHNAYEKKPAIIQRRLAQGTPTEKQWEMNELLGAFYVQIPLNGIQSIAVKESTESIIWIVITLTGGLIILAFFLLGDVSKANKNAQKLFWQARHDSLTKLPNRIQFEELVKSLIDDAKRDENTHYLCYLDLDRFKLVNDTGGHGAGDQLLCQVATALTDIIKDAGVLARLGGDEFGVLLKNSSLANAKKLSDAMCYQLKSYSFFLDDQVFDIGGSIGIVEINNTTESFDKVMSCADIACYSAKDSGRNRSQVYTESDEEIAHKSAEMMWVSKIQAALKEQRLVIYAQTIAAIAPNSNHSHFEILCRLRDGNNTIMPSEFLSAAERYNLMNKLDTYIIEQSFIALKNNLFKDLGKTGFISINLSGQSLSGDNFLEQVTSLIEQHNIDPNQICFEITETTTIKSPQAVQHFMKVLKEKGVRFALDDFGTGLSSLTYLKQFPVDYLKIDGSFICDIVSDPVDRKLVKSINHLAHSLNIKTIAEYVESKEILSLLSDMGVDYAQGYLINKPTAIEQIS